MKFCTKCGNPINANVKFCTKCGNPIKNLNAESEDINSHQEEVEPSKNINASVADTVGISKENAKEFVQESRDTANSESKQQDLNYKEDDDINYKPKASAHRNDEADGYVESNRNDNTYKKKKKSFFSGIFPKIIVAVVLVAAILIGVFFDRIRGEYYIMKANDAANVTEKYEYAVKAVKVLKSNDTKELLKSTIAEIAKDDVESAEDKLNQVSSFLSQGDYQNIAIAIKDKKIDKLYKDGKFQEAVAEFSEMDKLGGNFKDNKNYDDIMLNEISKITSTPLVNSKSLLMEDRQICYENFDDDPFDEIIEVKSNGKYSYNSGIKLNLYKMKNGQYKLVDTTSIDRAWNQDIQGVYNYAENKKGLFLHYANSSNNSGTSVLGVNNDKLQLKGTVFGNNYTKPDDVDNDGIYEVVSNSTSTISASKKDTSKRYKIYEDGRTPTEVNGSGQSSSTAKPSTDTKSSNDYIFKDSDKAYLTEDDVKDLSKDQLALARNEIFARHGYVFTTDEYKNYFSSKSWYVPNPSYDGSDSTLNQYEIANYQALQAWEKKK